MPANRWITLPVDWKLQDVQAGLNVIIAILCAAAVFMLVRHFWVTAARDVTKQKDVPAHRLLSLNTVGETIDVIWLLRQELFEARYRGLLVQCVSVLALTLCTMGSGFIARFSTRNTITTVQREVIGSLARRDTEYIVYDAMDIDAVMQDLRRAGVLQNQLLEFWPDPESGWVYNAAQWNSSWAMECEYNTTTIIPNTSMSDSCTQSLWSQWPWMRDNWWDWTQDLEIGGLGYSHLGWSNDDDIWSDALISAFGVEGPHRHDQESVTDYRMRIVSIHLRDGLRERDDTSDCLYREGPIGSAEYASATCSLHRDISGGSTDDMQTWGAYPYVHRFTDMARVYSQLFSTRLRRLSTNSMVVTPVDGQELAMIYQAYMVVKDTSGSLYFNITGPVNPKVWRTLDVRVEAAQISCLCVVVCSVLSLVVLCGLLNYWLFICFNRRLLDQTPQSKLDWMLRTLKEAQVSDVMKVPDSLSSTLGSRTQPGEALLTPKYDDLDSERKGPQCNARSTESFHDASTTPDSYDNHMLDSRSSSQNYALEDILPRLVTTSKSRPGSTGVRHSRNYRELSSRGSPEISPISSR
ncbi:hypothetical protein OHC33_007930 [Knufia fluminis]|uniref:Uncharacterized protein n=1 Tax=Knufia fluminis TaxID=191047 RepID=A0AAN8EHW5_9EURO|nr:hypothetical protein OHC33_007930 [Knufia fluminis]